LIDYRRPRLDEAETFAALHVQCWREAYAGFLPPELISTFSTERRLPMWQAVIPNPDRFVLAAYHEAKPVGFIISGSTLENHIENQDGHIWAIYIASQYHRKGIGCELIAAAATDWLAKDGKSMTLGVLAENVSARLFYEKLGARLVKTSTYDWDGYKLADAIYVFEDLTSLIP
jgi:ribosomal protein S18 acetylase RimI-like enzyme